MTKRVERRGRPPASEGAMTAIVHLKLPDAAEKFLEEERLARTVPPSKNAIAREAVLLGIEVMRARRGRK